MVAAQAIENAHAKSSLEDIQQLLHEFLYPDQDQAQMRKREQILKSATNLFTDHGYRKTSMEEVAKTAGVAKGTVYLYYRNKAELLMHALAFQNEQYMDQLSTALDPVLSPRDQLRQMISLSISMSRKLPLFSRLTGGDRELALVLQDIDDDTLVQVSKMKIDFIAKMIDAATEGKIAPPVVKQRAQVLLDLMYAVNIGGQWPQSEFSLDEYAELVANMLVNGLAAN